jgi:hypothetical protein
MATDFTTTISTVTNIFKNLFKVPTPLQHISKEEITAQVVNFVWNGLTDLKAHPVLTSKK